MSSEPAPLAAPARGDPQVFEQSFASAPDLADLTAAARRVLATSASLFLHDGAAATSIRDITRACGLSPGALYKHFASKDELLYVLVQHGHASLERRIAGALAAAADEPLPQTSAFVRAYVMGHLVKPALAQVVRREYLHLSEERYLEIVRRRRKLRHRLSDLLCQGADTGVFDLIDGPDSSTRAAVMILDMCSRTSDWYDPRHAEPPQRLAERYVQAALRIAGA